MDKEPNGMEGNKEFAAEERAFNSLNMKYQAVLAR